MIIAQEMYLIVLSTALTCAHVSPTGNRGSSADSDGKVTGSDNENVVMYRGAVLELDKVMAKLDNSQANRLQVEKEMRVVQQDRGLLLHYNYSLFCGWLL